MSTKKNILSPLKTGFIGLLFVLSNYAFATNYYVDATAGSDSNSGTSEAQAWKTLSKVSSFNFSTGDIIGFKKGQVFKGRLTYKGVSGTASNPVIFTAYGDGAKPILDGNGDFSTSWTLDGTHGPNIYTTKKSSSTRRLWVNGVEQKSVTQRRGNSHEWTELGKTAGCNWNWDAGKVWFYSPSGIPTGTFHSHLYSYTFSTSGADYIKISGLDIRGGYAAIYIENSDHIAIENCNIGYNSAQGVEATNANNILIEKNSFNSNFSLDFTGVASYGGTDNRGCYDAVLSDGNTNYCIIRNNDFFDWGHSAISFQGGGRSIQYNEIYNNYFSFENVGYGRAIDLNNINTKFNEVHHNYIYKQSTPSHTVGRNNHYHHNYFKDCTNTTLKSKENGQAMDLAAFAGNVTGNIIEYNTFENTEGPGIEIVATGSSSDDVSGNTFRKNLFINNGTNPYYSWGIGKGIAVQHYVDIRANNFHDNAFTSTLTSDTIYHRQAKVSAEEFNTRNGVQGDNISGNTTTVTDQGAGNVNEYNTGSGSTQTIQPVQVPSTPPVVPTVPETGAFIMDRSGLR